MTGPPVFTVIMATYGRGRHIMPSVRSVLAQTLGRFELLIVGDCCTDETAEVVAGIADPRVRWIALESRVGSQSGPNNAGIAAARADLIAYLGHDDIWEPSHLARLNALFEDPAVDFGVSGALFHLPNGIPGSPVMGIFDRDGDKHRFFFPPSAFAHRKRIVEAIGGWRMPMDIRAFVDADLLLRATAADLAFRSTQVVTVHKFDAGHRYLCYLDQGSDEQEAMLLAMAAPGHVERIAALVEKAKRHGVFMVPASRDFDRYAPGELARQNAARKGLLAAAVGPLPARATIRHVKMPCALDWKAQPILGVRWTRKNPRPKVLLPFTGGRARLTLRVYHARRAALGPLVLSCNAATVTVRPQRSRPSLWGRCAIYEAEIALRPDRASFVEFLLDDLQAPTPARRGIGLGPIVLTALPATDP